MVVLVRNTEKAKGRDGPGMPRVAVGEPRVDARLRHVSLRPASGNTKLSRKLGPMKARTSTHFSPGAAPRGKPGVDNNIHQKRCQHLPHCQASCSPPTSNWPYLRHPGNRAHVAGALGVGFCFFLSRGARQRDSGHPRA